MKEFDIVVVGAGPAGLMAAREASRRGVKVLLLEKKNAFGRKACGEAVSSNALDTAEISASDRKRTVLNKIKGCYIYAPNENKVVRLLAENSEYQEGVILDKPFFLRRLAEMAAEEGVTVWMNSEAKSVTRKNGSICGISFIERGKKKQVRSKTVIGCDGFNSTVLWDALRIRSPRLIPAVQYKLANCKGLEKEMLKAYLGREVSPNGYVWVFPTSETTANVGIGGEGRPIKPFLDRFIKKHPDMFGDAQTLNVNAAPIPIGGQLLNALDDNLLICGDAAGQIIPLTGGGIHSSLEGGKLAGKVMTEALSEGDTSASRLRRYWDEYESSWGARIRDSGKALKAIEALNDEELNELAELLSTRDIMDLANGFDITRVAKALLSHPTFALKISRILLS